jgi:hypothetical protein
MAHRMPTVKIVALAAFTITNPEPVPRPAGSPCPGSGLDAPPLTTSTSQPAGENNHPRRGTPSHMRADPRPRTVNTAAAAGQEGDRMHNTRLCTAVTAASPRFRAAPNGGYSVPMPRVSVTLRDEDGRLSEPPLAAARRRLRRISVSTRPRGLVVVSIVVSFVCVRGRPARSAGPLSRTSRTVPAWREHWCAHLESVLASPVLLSSAAPAGRRVTVAGLLAGEAFASRFWEQNGSGEAPPDAVSRGVLTSSIASEQRRRELAAMSSGCALTTWCAIGDPGRNG